MLILKFNKFSKTVKLPLVYYADLEAVLRKINNLSTGKKIIQKHEACSFGLFGLSDFYKNF